MTYSTEEERKTARKESLRKAYLKYKDKSYDKMVAQAKAFYIKQKPILKQQKENSQRYIELMKQIEASKTRGS